MLCGQWRGVLSGGGKENSAIYSKELHHDLSQQGLLSLLAHFPSWLFKRESTADGGGVFIAS